MLTKMDNNLLRSSPEAQGIASSAILDFVQTLESQIHETHSFMLLRHGHVVAEGWWSPYQPEYPHRLSSISKSFTSTAVGLAIDEGYFTIEDRVISFFPDEIPDEVSDNLKALKIRHLLSMSTGHDGDTMHYMGIYRADGQWIKGFFTPPVPNVPGTKFGYNTGASYILSAIVQKTTGLKMVDYLRPRFFEPVGIDITTWQESPEGINTGGFGLNATTEEIARFGQFYLQKGIWRGKRILSEAWIEEATSCQISNRDKLNSDWVKGYGYHFWQSRNGAYCATGAFGQMCIVMPEQDAVLAVTGGMPKNYELFTIIWENLLPAMDNEPLSEDNPSYDVLKNKLSHLAIAPVQGQATSPIAVDVSGRAYKPNDNAWHIETIILNCDEQYPTISVETPSGKDTIACGYGKWLKGEPTQLLNRPFDVDATPFVASGAWTANNCFTFVVRLYERPFFHTFNFHFDKEELTIETQVNVSFSLPEMQTIRTHKM